MIHLCPDELLLLPAALVTLRYAVARSWAWLRRVRCEVAHHHRWDHPGAGQAWRLYCDRCERAIRIEGPR